MYDIAIVGSGLAGLAAASKLNSFKVALFEKELRPGGRVLSGYCDGTPYDLGALFASKLPFPVDTDGIHSQSGSEIFLFAQDSSWSGFSVLECLAAYADASGHAKHDLDDFFGGKKSYREVHPRLAEAISAFFGLIHPAPIAESLPQRQRDGLTGQTAAFRRNANGAVVDALMKQSCADFFPGSNVVALKHRHAWIDIVTGEGKIRRARNVIMATPPAVAASLLPDNSSISAFLRQVNFYPGFSMVFLVEKNSVQDFSYVVSLDGPFNAAVKCERGGKVFIHAYCTGDRFLRSMGQDRIEFLRDTKEYFVRMKLVKSSEAISFLDSMSWSGVGPLISSPPYMRGAFRKSRVDKRLFLAGDYTWFDPREKMPYGMKAAFLSGIRAADEVISSFSGGGERGPTS